MHNKCRQVFLSVLSESARKMHLHEGTRNTSVKLFSQRLCNNQRLIKSDIKQKVAYCANQNVKLLNSGVLNKLNRYFILHTSIIIHPHNFKMCVGYCDVDSKHKIIFIVIFRQSTPDKNRQKS